MPAITYPNGDVVHYSGFLEMPKKACLLCENIIPNKNEGLSHYLRRKFCDRKCQAKWQKRKHWSLSSEFQKGHLSQNKGKKLSEKTKKLLSEATKKQMTKEAKIHLSQLRKGIPNYKLRKEKHPNWKGGVTTLANQIRSSLEYNHWRSLVFKRDSYTCRECKAKGVYIEADHVIAFSVILKKNNIKTLEDSLMCETLWNINNGRTLCKPCHASTPTYQNKSRWLNKEDNNAIA